MKTLITTIIYLAIVFSSNLGYAQDKFFSNADAFYKQFALDGRIDYKEIKNQPQVLEDLIETIAKADLEKMSAQAQKAFLINAYNLLVIKSISKNYPVSSVNNIMGFFDEKKHTVAGNEVTLDELEKEKLFADFSDPRLHFALVCGAKDCPDVMSFAFNNENLDAQLDEQTSRTLKQQRFLEVDDETKEIYLSKVFKWYAHDFDRDIVGFITKYSDTKLPTDYEIRYRTYDWDVNMVEILQTNY